MPPSEEIQALVSHFSFNRDHYKHSLNETELRVQFVNPLFEALGWDVYNKNRFAEAYKDVVHEYALKGRHTTEAPDYCFRIGGIRKFYVEAKRPGVSLQMDSGPAYQLRSYGWTSKLPLSVLTNFEYFAVYDCKKQPRHGDSASVSRVDLYHFHDYISRWDELEATFSRSAAYKGGFDKYVDSTTQKRGTTEVDDAFLNDLRSWRELLAKNVARRNPEITQRQLNFAVQRTLDRVVFLRICEDRGLEQYGQLRELLGTSGVYARLLVVYERADEKYNSGLFHFANEAGRLEEPDSLSFHLIVDDAVLKEIITNLYYPARPYRFAKFPPDILGQVYEQFLGQVINVSPKRTVKIEDKPAIRKAHGVFYTPTYVVEYILRHVLEPKLSGASPKTVTHLRLLDPACGSGSFLIAAFQFLLDWHLQWYLNDGFQKHKDVVVPVGVGEWRLTIQERRRILLNNIFGVDIDPQAVEVTKLSLLLKVLESESEESVGENLRLFQQRALPDLGLNIKCGNSLVESDYFSATQLRMIDDEELIRVNTFDWRARDNFKNVLDAGGFDLVVGNPPYLYSAADEKVDYLARRFGCAEYQTDYYVYFIEKALQLTKKGGLASFIVSDSWLNSQSFTKTRDFLLTKNSLRLLTVFDYPVFKKAALENSIFVAEKSGKSVAFPVERFRSPWNVEVVNTVEVKEAQRRKIIDPWWSGPAENLVEKLLKRHPPLSDNFLVNRGIHAYRTDGYGKSAFGAGYQSSRDKTERSYHSKVALNETYLPEYKGKSVHRFVCDSPIEFLAYGPWLAEPRDPRFMLESKVVFRKILSQKLHGAFLGGPAAVDQSLYILLAKDRDEASLKTALGVLSSRLGAWYLRTRFSIYDRLYPWYTKSQLSSFPVPNLDETVADIVTQLQSTISSVREVRLTVQDRTLLKRKADRLENLLDARVSELYNLNAEEEKMIDTANDRFGR